MSLKFFKELEIEKEIDINELKGLEINFSVPNSLEIIAPRLPTVGTIGKLLYSVYNKLNYLFDYLEYQVVVQEAATIDKSTIQEYFSFAIETPFLWKDKKDLIFFCEQKELLENFAFRRNVIHLRIPDQPDLTNWKLKFAVLKEILAKLGLTGLRFGKEKNVNNGNLQATLVESGDKNGVDETSSNKNGRMTVEGRKSNSGLSNGRPMNNGRRLNKSVLFNEWRGRKLFELGVHSKFSTLDGISSPTDYATSAQQKNYAALAVTDHYNVQSFPEFSKHQSSDLKIVYGCEMEMLEDELPPYLFNYPEQFLERKVNDLIYCVFDLETTGFFSQYNEIIEIGYVIYHKGKIIQEREYLICPEKEISAEMLAAWYTSIDPQELKKSPKIKEILPTLRQEWKDCVLVAHNAGKFDYGFLNKVWKENFGEQLPHPVLDTLPLSWILFPERKSYSLERLSHVPGRAKVAQTHRALDDSKLLAELLEKLLKTLKENKISQWGEVKGLIKDGFFPNRGYKVKALASSQEGLYNLYRLVTLSHTKRLFKKPSVFRSDLEKYRPGLLIGAAGGREGETFSLFSSFNFEEKKREKLRFYDYIEVNGPENFRHLWLNGLIRETELKEMTKKIISTAEDLKIPMIASHHVYYCERKERLLKEIIIANEGINGSRHYLYNQATLEDKEDRFASLPPQHLLNLEEMINNWAFLNDKHLIEKLIFKYPQAIVNKVGEVNIKQPPLNYSSTGSSRSEENDLISAYTQRTKEIFGIHWPNFVKERIEKEWQIIKGRYVFIYWLAYKVVQKTHQDGSLVGSRGSIGSSFIAYLCGITDLNPLPFYKFCPSCRYAELYKTQDRVYCCYDYREKEKCPNCSSLLTMEGHNLPFETFFGWEGEKTPDIDLNFSGEYQKVAHNYVRQLLGEESVYRIGTINTLSQQTAEIFWREHLKLRKKLNPNFNEERWFKEWINSEKLKELEKNSLQLRKEKNQLEREAEELDKKRVVEKEEEIRKIWEELRNEKERPREEIIEELKGIKRTTGQHPGGLLITLPNTDIQKYTPLNYPADNRQSEWMTTHFEYSFLSEIFLKVDILGHDEPTVLQKLFQLTGVDPNKISFHDENIMQLFTSADTLGIPEFGTDFVKRNLLTPLKPTKFSQLVQISGFSHGTNVWTQNQHTIYKSGQLSLSELIACREDIWNFLVFWGVENKNAFIATEFIRKGKWDKLPESIKEEMKSKLKDKEGELYFSILSKIKYIFPKPHAIAYTMTAWRTAFYKVYHPQEFYSVLLTYHTDVYDIWLMTLNPETINFRLEGLLDNPLNYKNNEKELLSIIKVFEELSKEKKRLEKTVKNKKFSESALEKMDVDKILESIKEKINNSGDEDLIKSLQKNGKTWKLTAKEKHLLFTLRVVLEMEIKGLKFTRGLDFNNSEVKDFKIENNTIYFPFTAVAGIGEKLAEKIIAYRQEKGKITNKWKEELTGVLNINHIQQLENLEKYNLIINLEVK